MATPQVQLGRLAGLMISARPSAFASSLVLWVLAGSFARLVLHQSLAIAVASGALVLVLHWVGAIWHQLGHAWAARRTGYPMSGIRLWYLLSTALYPADEPALPVAIHVRRALGGARGSLVLSVVAGTLALALRTGAGAFWWVLAFFFLDNLVIFTLGAFLPLGFTDGSTLLRLRREQKRSQALVR